MAAPAKDAKADPMIRVRVTRRGFHGNTLHEEGAILVLPASKRGSWMELLAEDVSDDPTPDAPAREPPKPKARVPVARSKANY